MEHILRIAHSALSIMKPVLEEATGEKISDVQMAKITMVIATAGMAGVKIGTEIAKLSNSRAVKQLTAEKKRKKVTTRKVKEIA